MDLNKIVSEQMEKAKANSTFEPFDIEKAKAGRKVVELQEPHTPVVKWDVFGDTFVYLLDGYISPLSTLLDRAHTILAVESEERYVNEWEDGIGKTIFRTLDGAKGCSNGHGYKGTYKLVKV